MCTFGEGHHREVGVVFWLEILSKESKSDVYTNAGCISETGMGICVNFPER